MEITVTDQITWLQLGSDTRALSCLIPENQEAMSTNEYHSSSSWSGAPVIQKLPMYAGTAE